MKRNVISILLCLSVYGGIISCTERFENVNAIRLSSKDSLSYCFDKVCTVTIKVGDKITNKPVSSQVVLTPKGEKYLLADLGHIYVFDWNSGELEDSIPTAACGTINNYSGFAYINQDSIYVYNYSQKNLHLINSKGEILKTRSLDKTNKRNHVALDAEAINRMRISRVDDRIVMSGSMFASVKDKGDESCKATAMYDMTDSDLKGSLPFPRMYSSYNWGGIYMNVPNHCTGQRCMLYSYPISHYVYRYGKDFSTCDSIYMGSRYCRSIRSFDGDALSALTDKNEMAKYFLSEHSYADIFYDGKNGCIYRLAYHPNETWVPGEMFNQPFSVIVADDKGRMSCETQIYDDPHYNWMNAHVTSCGLAVAYDSPDENVITFRYLKKK